MSSKPFFSCGFLLQFRFFSVFSLSFFYPNPLPSWTTNEQHNNTTTRQHATGTTPPPSLRRTGWFRGSWDANQQRKSGFIYSWVETILMNSPLSAVKSWKSVCNTARHSDSIGRFSDPATNPIVSADVSSAQLPLTERPVESGSSSPSSTFLNRLTVPVLTVYSSTRRTLHVEWRHAVTSKYWPVY